jgi:hypothetical protein
MFHTEELQQIIDQLQHAQGSGLGYFDTLLLIFKLIGLCAVPTLFVISLIVILVLGPKWISYKLTPVSDTMKLYDYYFVLKRKKDKYFLKPSDLEESRDYEKLLCKRGFLRYKITCGFSVIVLLLLSPFLFNDHTKVLFGIFTFCIIVGLVLTLFFCNDSFGCDDWSDIAKENPVNKAEIRSQFREKIQEAFKTIDTKKLKDIDNHKINHEIEQTINATVNDRYYKAVIYVNIDER